MSTVIQWIILLAILVAISKLYEYFKDKKAEKEHMVKEIERQGKENMRLKAMITDKCPECGIDKDEYLICKCGFTYEDGDHCCNCGKYFSYKDLKRSYSMVHLVEVHYCTKCNSKRNDK